MPSLLDLTGKRFGRLTVSQRSNNDHYCDGSGYRIVMWVCDCDCGTRCTVSGKLLRAGKTTSCGCVQSEASREKLRKGRQVIPVNKMPAYERKCRECGKPFIGRRAQAYCGSAECWRMRSNRKRKEQRHKGRA